MLYGFNREHSRILKGIARREGLAPRAGTTVKYPKPLIDDAQFIIGKPTANITAPATCTINIYSGTQGSETSTGRQISAYAYANLNSAKMCTATLINGKWYAGCYQS
jgi:hypothetical protein